MPRDDDNLELFYNINKVYYFFRYSIFKRIVMAGLVRHRAYEIMMNITKLLRILRHRFIDPVAACAAMTIFLYLGI